MKEDKSTLKLDEYHPSANSALVWYKEWALMHPEEYFMLRESIASTSLSGNRLAQILHGTLERLANGSKVSDRYLLGLCWFIRNDYGK